MSRFFTRPEMYIHAGSIPLPAVCNIRINNAPAYLSGIRALFVSDVHIRKADKEYLDRLCSLINAQKADILLMGGDYGENRKAAEALFEHIAQLCFPYGKYAVPGNNDCELYPDISEMRNLLQQADCRLLVNESADIHINGGILRIGGCDDYRTGTPKTKDLFQDSENAYRILLSHYPIRPECECELMLSGHTHGGQFNILGITPYSICFEKRFHLSGIRGFCQHGSMQTIICSGIGMSRLPLRIGVRPEICLVEF